MQNNYQNQPLGPFPADVALIIAQQNPQAYALLSQTSRRLQTIVQPALQQICQAPVKGYEIARAMFMMSSTINLKGIASIHYTWTRFNEITIKGPDSYVVPLSVAGKNVDQLLKSGKTPTLDIMLQVYKNRLSCIKSNPNYVNELLAQEYLKRFDRLRNTYNTSDISHYYDAFRNLVDQFSQVLNQNLPDFYYTQAPLIRYEYVDYIQRLEAEGQRLLKLAKNQ